MDRGQIEAALTALGARLDAEGLLGELYVVGGAALALAYDSRRVTKDIDAIFEPKMPIYRLAAEVADERGLRRADDVLDFVVEVAGERRVSPAAQFFVQSLFPDGP